MKWLGSKVVVADTFGELLDNLQDKWIDHDQGLLQRREEAAHALLHAEQRILLAQKFATEFAESVKSSMSPTSSVTSCARRGPRPSPKRN